MKIGKFILLITISFFPFRLPAYAEAEIRASLSSNQVSINDTLRLSIEIEGLKDVPSPGNLQLPGFNARSAGRTSSFQFINGKTSSITKFTYVISPTRVGNLQIPPITMMHEGKKYTTEAIPVTVTPAQTTTAPAAPSSNQAKGNVSVPSEGLKPVFMTAKVDKSKCYVGDQILLTVQFLRRPQVRLTSQPRYSEPEMTGFLVEALKQNEYTSTIQGARYVISELRYALFPTSDGNFAIGNATIDLAIRGEPDPFNPNSFFESFFGQSQRLRLNTRAIPIRVRALPQNKPIDFSGAVGRYKLAAKVDTAEPEVGKPFNLIVTLEGVGNINGLKEPILPEMNSFRRYETITESKVNREGKVLYGSKVFKTLLIPQVSGQLEIPPVSFTYFNPTLPQYVTEQTSPITLSVKTGTLGPADQEPAFQAAPGQVSEGIRIVEKDIRFIKTGKIKTAAAPLIFNAPFLLVNTIPPVFALAAGLILLRNRRRLLYADDYRARGALKSAQKELKEAAKMMNDMDPAPYYAALSHALTMFLSSKLSVSATGLVWNELEKILTEKGVDDELREKVKNILSEADMARFAPASFADGGRDTSLTLTKSTLRKLDKVL